MAEHRAQPEPDGPDPLGGRCFRTWHQQEVARRRSADPRRSGERRRIRVFLYEICCTSARPPWLAGADSVPRCSTAVVGPGRLGYKPAETSSGQDPHRSRESAARLERSESAARVGPSANPCCLGGAEGCQAEEQAPANRLESECFQEEAGNRTPMRQSPSSGNHAVSSVAPMGPCRFASLRVASRTEKSGRCLSVLNPVALVVFLQAGSV